MSDLRRPPAPRLAERPPPPRDPWRRGVVQDVVDSDGVLDLGPGYLGPDLLPVELVGEAARRSLEEYGPAALTYGHNPGPEPLRELIAARSTAADRRPCPVDGVVITAGTSMALHLLSTVLARPGDVVLLDELSYDLAVRIFIDNGLVPVRVAGDGSGQDPAALAERVDRVRGRGSRIAFCYLVPTFANPVGTTVPLDRRREILAVAAAKEVLLVEDDAYAELSLAERAGPGAPPSMAALAGYQGVVRLGSFAKTLGAGLRLGWLATAPERAAALARHGLFVSGGCVNHMTALAVATLLAGPAYDEHLAALRRGLRERRDAVFESLTAGLGEQVLTRRTAGGLFLWVELTARDDEAAMLAAAAAAGVRVAAGSRFGPARVCSARLAFGLCPPTALAEAGGRLARAWTVR